MVTPELFIYLGFYLAAAAAFIPGLAAYRGTWRRWAAFRKYYELGKRSYFGFTMFYFGVALALVTSSAVATLLLAPHALSQAFLWAAALMLLPLAASVAYLPPFLLPGWYRQWVAEGAPEQELLRSGTGPFTLQKRADN